jgi:putative (di)nucleoside polyphosphate hydrolase
LSEPKYREGVGLVVINADRLVLIAQRIDNPGEAWQMPQGGIDAGETPEDAALREMKEEIGTDKAVIIASSAEWLSYDLPDDLWPKLWHGRYRGQKQKWFALRFEGDDSDIDIATEHPEFSRWKWATAAEAIDSIVPFKRDLYRAVFTEFAGFVSA